MSDTPLWVVGVKLALCEEGRGGMGPLCVKSVVEQEPCILCF